MSRFKKIIGCLLALCAIAGAVAAYLHFLQKKKLEQEELDSYLMNSDDDPEVIVAGYGSEEALDSDFQEWDSLSEDDTVEVTFLTRPDQSSRFQNLMADAGCSSTYDSKTGLLDVTLHGPLNKEELQTISKALETAMRETDSTYHGFAFV